MSSKRLSRRDFVKCSLSALVLAPFPVRVAFGQTGSNVRLEWQQFKQTSNYSSFIDAVRAMRANTNASDKSSWQYWVNVHVNYCPHGISYFLAWHRGYLYYLEQQLRTVSGNSGLVLPYWDYYSNPNLPSEFTDPATGNPLYVNRVNTNVYNALTLAPFSSSIINFPRGTSNAFEPSLENAPHNPVHNIIGNYMATMQSPLDPIFFLHHANIDRLWAAWVAADSGRTMPSQKSSYWKGSFTYASNLTISRLKTYSTTGLGYTYQDMQMPSALPAQAQAARIIQVQARPPIMNRPAVGTFPLSTPRSTGTNRFSLGGAQGISLENSVSVQVPVPPANSQSLQDILSAARTPSSSPPAGPYKSIQVVLDNVSLTDAGRLGGYFYNVYLNLPVQGVSPGSQDSYFIGTLGPFEIAGAMHHGSTARLVYPATRKLAEVTSPNDQVGALTVSLVRVNGANTPQGPTINIGEARIEISGDEVE